MRMRKSWMRTRQRRTKRINDEEHCHEDVGKEVNEE